MDRESKIRLATTPPGWMYEFDLGDGVKTQTLGPELSSVHVTRERMVFPILDRLYPRGLEEADCLDVACNEGYFSHQLYRRGARVKGIDIREINVERARTIQEILGFDRRRLSFERADFFDLKEAPGTYEVSLFLGILYHIENPMGALRLLHHLTRTLAVVETQLTRQHGPIQSGCGESGVFRETLGSVSVFLEEDMEENNLAAYRSLSFVPNPAVVPLMLHTAGFATVLRVEPSPDLNSQFVNGDRGVFLAWK